MITHVIRLRKPWRCQLGAGQVTCRRGFNRPTGLDDGERVWLIVDGVRGAAQLTINDGPLGAVAAGVPSGGWDMTDLLQSHNELAISIACDDPAAALAAGPAALPGDLIAEVRLEIRA